MRLTSNFKSTMIIFQIKKCEDEKRNSLILQVPICHCRCINERFVVCNAAVNSLPNHCDHVLAFLQKQRYCKKPVGFGSIVSAY